MKSNNNSPDAKVPSGSQPSVRTGESATLVAPSAPASRTPPGLKPIGPVLASIIAGLEPK